MSGTRYGRKLRLLADLTAFNICAIAVYALRFYSGLVPLPLGIPPVLPYLKLLLAADLLWLLLALSGLAYRAGMRLEASLRALTRLYLTVCFGILVFAFLYRSFTFSMTVVFSALLLAYPCVLLMHARFRERLPVSRVLLLGSAREVADVLAHGRSPEGGMVRIQAAAVTDALPADAVPVPAAMWQPAAGPPAEMQQVWATASATANPAFPAFLERCGAAGVSVRFVPFIPALTPGARPLPLLTQLVPLNCLRHPLQEPHNRLLKRASDLLGGAAGLLLCAPLLLGLACYLLLREGRPVFIRQKRMSQDGKTFRMLKFRTMRLDAEEESGPVWAQANDPRCTPLGAWLRKLSLDELPQLWNVVRGDMSLVGPRPERPFFVRRFAGEMCYYEARHSVKTGITGWAQANGLRGNTSIEMRTLYDLYYIENWSLWFDLKIILLTIREFLFHQSAY